MRKIETLTDNERAAVEVDFDGLGAKALRIVDALTADRDEWKLRCAQLEKKECEQAREIREWKARAEAADEQTVAYKEDVLKLRNLNSRLLKDNASAEDCARDCMRALESELATLRAENERLRANATTWDELLRRAESRLAAATELVSDWRNSPVDDDEGVSLDLERRSDTFLANQPAEVKP